MILGLVPPWGTHGPGGVPDLRAEVLMALVQVGLGFLRRVQGDELGAGRVQQQPKRQARGGYRVCLISQVRELHVTG